MIEKMTIKNVATYSSEGITIDNLKKVNFIYGSNGSGKTTITNFIDSPNSPEFQNKGCELIWENTTPLKVLTYNKKFRDKNFGKGKIDGVFTLGNATKEHLEEIAKMQKKLSEIKDEGTQKADTIKNKNEEKTQLEYSFQDNCWANIYKKFENIFNPAFDGSKSKERFKNKLLSEYQSNKRPVKTIDELKEKSKTIFGETPTTMNIFGIIDFRRLTEIENNTIWNKKIIGKSDIEIGKLIQRLNLNDWVNQGRLLLDNETEICPFCQRKTIDNDFRRQLEAYFDESFISDTKTINELSEEYANGSQNISNILEAIESAESTNKNTKLNIEMFKAYLKTLNQQFVSNKDRLNNKLKEPSRSIDISSSQEQLENIQGLINKANIEINEHNNIVANFQVEKTNLISDVWKFLTEANKVEIDRFVKQSEGGQKGIDALQKQKGELVNSYKELEAKIKEANKGVTSVQPSVDAINDTLMAYGFDNFKIVSSQTEPNQYQIKREDGSIAEKTLSEGEVTFITFLYFLQLAKGSISEDSISEDRVLVVDDPISSLDSTVLFVVSSLLKEVIKSIKKGAGNIKQLIILTHNVYFHKEVSYIDRKDNNRDDVHHWILRKNGSTSNIQNYLKKNPIRGSYELLWDELRHADKLSGITIQNTMRRILETYFKTMGKKTDDDIIDCFSNPHEKEICRSLLCWVNDGSHCISDDLHVEHPDAINDKFSTVFKRTFENMNHIDHYNMMMGVGSETQETV